MYAVQSDLETRYGTEELAQLSDRTAGVVVNATVVARAIADAQAEIDSYVGARYAVPLAPVPDLINRVCCDIARYYLHEDRVTDQVRKRYEDCVDLLQAIATGKAELSLAADGSPAPSAGAGVMVSAPERVFSAETLADYG